MAAATNSASCGGRLVAGRTACFARDALVISGEPRGTCSGKTQAWGSHLRQRQSRRRLPPRCSGHRGSRFCFNTSSRWRPGQRPSQAPGRYRVFGGAPPRRGREPRAFALGSRDARKPGADEFVWSPQNTGRGNNVASGRRFSGFHTGVVEPTPDAAHRDQARRVGARRSSRSLRATASSWITHSGPLSAFLQHHPVPVAEQGYDSQPTEDLKEREVRGHASSSVYFNTMRALPASAARPARGYPAIGLPRLISAG